MLLGEMILDRAFRKERKWFRKADNIDFMKISHKHVFRFKISKATYTRNYEASLSTFKIDTKTLTCLTFSYTVNCKSNNSFQKKRSLTTH